MLSRRSGAGLDCQHARAQTQLKRLTVLVSRGHNRGGGYSINRRAEQSLSVGQNVETCDELRRAFEALRSWLYTHDLFLKVNDGPGL